MTIDPGHFQLYPYLDPPLSAGTYRFTASQPMSGSINGNDEDEVELGASDLGVQAEPLHIEITSPRYLLSPDQVLSTYPPAESEGAWGARLPQVVIKRRTLPWERDVTDDSTTPWLALVVFAPGEAEIRSAQPVAECVTPGVELDGKADVATANYLAIDQQMIDTVMPTRKDVPLLAHARQVDINDTELMMGDDDGFLAVVIANRLPLPARDASGAEVPTTYTAALVSLEGQFERLRPDSPPRSRFTDFMIAQVAVPTVTYAEYDHISMGNAELGPDGVTALGGFTGAAVIDGGVTAGGTITPLDASPARISADQVIPASATTGAAASAAYAKPGWAREARITKAGQFTTGTSHFSQERRFPVLLHWDFTTTGSRTFRSLMTDLDSGLLGTIPAAATTGTAVQTPTPKRLPLEVVETGHVGLTHRTRSGEETRTWYRGPLLAHPADATATRLPLAHTSDQLRIYVPDGREDLSLAAAFEIGRLLALNTPSIVATLLRWRRTRYVAARASTIWGGTLSDRLHVVDDVLILPQDIGYLLGKTLVANIADDPVGVLGDPMELYRAGETPVEHRDVATVMAKGFGVEFNLAGDLGDVLLDLGSRAPLLVAPDTMAPREVTDLLRGSLTGGLNAHLMVQVSDTLTGSDQPVMGNVDLFAVNLRGGGGPLGPLASLLDDTRDLDRVTDDDDDHDGAVQ